MAKDYGAAAQNIFGCPLNELEKDYFQYIDLLGYDKVVLERIAELCTE